MFKKISSRQNLLRKKICKSCQKNTCKIVILIVFLLLIFDSGLKYIRLEQQKLTEYQIFPIIKISLLVFFMILCFLMKNETQISDKFFDFYLFSLKILILTIFLEFDIPSYEIRSEGVALIPEGFKFCFIESVISNCFRGLKPRIFSNWFTVFYLVFRTSNSSNFESFFFLPLIFFWILIQKLQWKMKNNFTDPKKSKSNETQISSDFDDIFKNDSEFSRNVLKNCVKKTNDCICIFNNEKKPMFANKAAKNLLAMEEINLIGKHLLNLEVTLAKSKKNLLDGVNIVKADNIERILLDKNLSELSSINSIGEKTCVSSIIDKILEELKARKKEKTKISIFSYKFSINVENLSEFSNLFFDGKKKGYCYLVPFERKPFFLLLIKNSDSAKFVEKNDKISKSFVYYAEEFRICLNVTNILQQSIEKYFDFSKNLSILKPLTISMKLMMCLQEELIYFKQMMSPKEKPQNIMEFDLRSFLAEIASLFSFQADMRGIDFQITYDKNLASSIQSDPLKIKIILVNLLKKAFASTLKGKIEIKAESENFSTIKISIIDNGVGLTSDEKSQYTEVLLNNNFSNLNDCSPSLGLILSNYLVKAISPKKSHGLNLVSSQRAGSNFNFLIEDKSFRCHIDEFSDEEELSVNYKRLQERTLDKKFLSGGTQINQSTSVRKISNLRETILESTYKYMKSIKSPLTGKTIQRRSLNTNNNHNFAEIKCSKSNLFEADVSTIHCSKLGSEYFWGSSDYLILKTIVDPDDINENQSKNTPKAKRLQPKTCSCCEIVVVDDDEFSNYSIKLLIEQQFLNIECTSDVEKAMAIIKTENPCCQGVKVVCIGVKPKTKKSLEQYEKCFECFKNNSKIGLIALVAGNISQKKGNYIKNAGFSAYLSKPIFLNMISNCFLKYINTTDR